MNNRGLATSTNWNPYRLPEHPIRTISLEEICKLLLYLGPNSVLVQDFVASCSNCQYLFVFLLDELLCLPALNLVAHPSAMMTAPARISTPPAALAMLIRSPRKMAPKIITSTTLSLSMGATFETGPTFNAWK